MKKLMALGCTVTLGLAVTAQAQVAGHCSQTLTLESLTADMVQQNLVGEPAFWNSDLTKVHLLLANGGQLALAQLAQGQGDQASRAVRDLVAEIEQTFDLPIPDGGPLVPSLRPNPPDVLAIEQLLTRLQVMEPWVDVPFTTSLAPDLGIELETFYALWSQARAYAGDPQAQAYVLENQLQLPRSVSLPKRFSPARVADSWNDRTLMMAVEDGGVTWVEAENIVWGWLKAGQQIRIQAFALLLTQRLQEFRNDFVEGRPDFDTPEPLPGYFSAWQRWEDLAARLLLLMGEREVIPSAFYHQSISLGLNETEPNIAAYDASQLFAAWQANGYAGAGGGVELIRATREARDVRAAQDLYVFLQVLTRGGNLGAERLRSILLDLQTAADAQWLGGPLLMEAFIELNLRREALAAAEIAASSQQIVEAPYAYVTPLIRIGEIEMARDILSVFHREACTRVAQSSSRTYSWIEWLPLTSASNWRVPVSRFDGI